MTYLRLTKLKKIAVTALFIMNVPLSIASCLGHQCNCTFGVDGINFGLYNPFAPEPNDTTGNISVSCNAADQGVDVSYEISLDTGKSGSFAKRKLASANRELGYNLYTDASRTLVWGDGSSISNRLKDAYSSPNTQEIKSYPIYGRIEPNQNVAAGDYSDLITVTLIF
jgi:spore coat protein U-like protein